MTNWTKYDYLCTDCDALIEITTMDDLTHYRGWCSCGSPNLTEIGHQDVTILTQRHLDWYQEELYN